MPKLVTTAGRWRGPLTSSARACFRALSSAAFELIADLAPPPAAAGVPVPSRIALRRVLWLRSVSTSDCVFLFRFSSSASVWVMHSGVRLSWSWTPSTPVTRSNSASCELPCSRLLLRWMSMGHFSHVCKRQRLQEVAYLVLAETSLPPCPIALCWSCCHSSHVRSSAMRLRLCSSLKSDAVIPALLQIMWKRRASSEPGRGAEAWTAAAIAGLVGLGRPSLDNVLWEDAKDRRL